MRSSLTGLSAMGAGAAIMLFGWAAPASAASVIPYTVPSGQAPCSAVLQEFGTLVEQRVTSVQGGTQTVTVAGVDVEVTVSNDARSLDWTSDAPVSCLSLKGGSGSASSFLYPYTSEQTSDSNLIAPGSGQITQYTVAVGDITVTPPFEPTDVSQCSDLNVPVGQCPDTETPLVITTWNLDNPNELVQCTCNITFTTCDLNPDGVMADKCFPRTVQDVPSVAEFFVTPFCLTTSTGGKPRSGSCF